MRLDARGIKSGTPGKRPRLPSGLIASTEKQLTKIAGGINAKLLAAVKPYLKGDGTISHEDIKRAMSRVHLLTGEVGKDGAKKIAVQNASHVNAWNAREIKRTIGVAVPEFSQKIGKKWISDHVAKIVSIEERGKSRVLSLLKESAEKSTRVETLRNNLQEKLDINYRSARLIARDQILNLNAKLTRDRHQRAGITEYRWMAVGDKSVRSNHADLDGEIFSYDDPPMGGGTTEDDPGHAGEGIGCRCQAIPIIPEFEDL